MQNKEKIKLSKLNMPSSNLDPLFVTGLIEAEGSFSITKHKDNRAKHKMNIGLCFRITMLSDETELLNMVKDFFCCGNLSIEDKRGAITFVVRDINSINNIVIPHFINYPLRGTKHLDFLSFKETTDILNSKKHLTKEGINEIINISNIMNSYREFPIEYSPNHTIENNYEYIPIDGNYINGFIAGDGCLALNIKDVNFARMSLQISQHKNNRPLLLSIAKFFKYPNKIYYHGINSLQITLSGIKIWESVIFNHFCEYPLHGNKTIRLNKLFIIRELMLNKNHLMKVGRYRQWKPDIKLV